MEINKNNEGTKIKEGEMFQEKRKKWVEFVRWIAFVQSKGYPLGVSKSPTTKTESKKRGSTVPKNGLRQIDLRLQPLIKKMSLKIHHYNYLAPALPSSPMNSQLLRASSSTSSLLFGGTSKKFHFERDLGLYSFGGKERLSRNKNGIVVASSSNNVVSPLWDSWKPDRASSAPSFSDVLWPSAAQLHGGKMVTGAFAAMAILGKVDQILAGKGISMTIAPLGSVCAVLFATPSAPTARKYNMFMAQIGCAAMGVLAFSIFGPGWLARSTALAASIAFMIYTHSAHPPAASMPLLFIDGTKFHHLNFWYALFPGATGCIILCLIQEIVSYLKDNVKF